MTALKFLKWYIPMLYIWYKSTRKVKDEEFRVLTSELGSRNSTIFYFILSTLKIIFHICLSYVIKILKHKKCIFPSKKING